MGVCIDVPAKRGRSQDTARQVRRMTKRKKKRWCCHVRTSGPGRQFKANTPGRLVSLRWLGVSAREWRRLRDTAAAAFGACSAAPGALRRMPKNVPELSPGPPPPPSVPLSPPRQIFDYKEVIESTTPSAPRSRKPERLPIEGPCRDRPHFSFSGRQRAPTLRGNTGTNNATQRSLE